MDNREQSPAKQEFIEKSKTFWNPNKTQFWQDQDVDLVIDRREGYRRVRPLSKEDEAELPTFVMLRRMILFAWMGSHAETDLAKQEGPAYAEGTCEMAEKYLTKFG